MCVLHRVITLQYHDATASLTSHFYVITLALANRQDLGGKADILTPPNEKLFALAFDFFPSL